MTTQISGGRRGAIAGIPVAYLAVWAAVYAVASILPAIPLVGGGTFGGQEFILTLAGILFGPIAGAIAATDRRTACKFHRASHRLFRISPLFIPIPSARW